MGSNDNKNNTEKNSSSSSLKSTSTSPAANNNNNTTSTTKSSSSFEKHPSIERPSSSSREGGGGGIDAHPYARGSVIEVYHVQKSTHSDSDDDDDDSSSSEEEEKDVDFTKPDHSSLPKNVSIRLCDIIDRAAITTTTTTTTTTNTFNTEERKKWRYYVHYRDFNRRMDEWININRIVSPPSIGNAKVRALKKKKEEEERLKQLAKHKQEEEEPGVGGSIKSRRKRKRCSSGREVELLENEGDISRPRLSRSTSRRSGAGAGTAGGGGVAGGVGGSGSAASSVVSGAGASTDASGVTADGAAGGVGAVGTTTRRQRKRRSAADGGKAEGGGGAQDGGVIMDGGASSLSSNANNNASLLVGAAAHAAVAATAEEHIGVDVVATVPAQELDEHEGLDEASLREHEEVTKVKNVMQVELGPHRMETWYFSPIPKELLKDGVVEVLYVCEFTLNFFTRKSELLRYQAKLPRNRRHPPGNEIYRNKNLSMFEVDGFDERIYCQNLCYIAKMFLDHKTLYYDVDPFLFYVLCEVDERGFHPVGYYSKEKYSDVGYNLACILTFPSQQRKGYGRFLISFSYELSKKEEKVGSPEKPISDLGQQAYLPYWTSTIVDFLRNTANEGSMSIMDISKRTSIMAEDIVFALNQLGILKFINGVYFIAAERNLLEQLAKKHPVKEPKVDPTKLHWTPFITDVKRDKFSIHSKRPSVKDEERIGIAEL